VGSRDRRAAYKQTDVAPARRLLQDLARRLEDRYRVRRPVCAKGVEETLTVLTLGLVPIASVSRSRRTNAIESLISRTRHVKRNVKRWRGGQMVLRWTAAAFLEARERISSIEGHKRHAEARRRAACPRFRKLEDHQPSPPNLRLSTPKAYCTESVA